MKGKKWIIGIVLSWIIAGGLFWLSFFVVAPSLAYAIPSSAWKPFLDFVIYVVIAYIGGIGIPLWVGIAGTALSLELWK
jgi:hypothetical protein